MISICKACGEFDNNIKMVNHHISYFPEIKVKVHRPCHIKIHNGTAYQELIPKKDDINRFYFGSINAERPLRPEIKDTTIERLKKYGEFSPATSIDWMINHVLDILEKKK